MLGDQKKKSQQITFDRFFKSSLKNLGKTSISKTWTANYNHQQHNFFVNRVPWVVQVPERILELATYSSSAVLQVWSTDPWPDSEMLSGVHWIETISIIITLNSCLSFWRCQRVSMCADGAKLGAMAGPLMWSKMANRTRLGMVLLATTHTCQKTNSPWECPC